MTTQTTPENTEHRSPCGCLYRWYRWGGWTQEEACADHPIEPEPEDGPTPEERRSAHEFGSRSATLP